MTQLKSVRGGAVELAPEQFRAELGDWLNFGEPPDNELLIAILCNDLGHTIALTADAHGSWSLVRETLRWLWVYAPASFGSVDNVKAWRARGGAEGRPQSFRRPRDARLWQPRRNEEGD